MTFFDSVHVNSLNIIAYFIKSKSEQYNKLLFIINNGKKATQHKNKQGNN